MMDQNTGIDALRLRYVVPFTWKSKGGAEDFETVCKAVAGQPEWKLKDSGMQNQDIYSYISDMLTQREGAGRHIGACFSRAQSQKTKFRVYRKDAPSLSVTLADEGLFLFRESLGFFWYEISLAEKDGFTTEALILFQNAAKELSFFTAAMQLAVMKQDCLEMPEEKLITGQGDSFDENGLIRARGVKKGVFYPLEEARQLLPEAEGEADSEYLLIKNGDTGSYELRRKCWQKKLPGLLIRDHLASLPAEITFLPERIPQGGSSKDLKVPDKALLYQYVLVCGDDDDREGLTKTAFYLTNGYTSAYRMPPQAAGEMLFTAGNVCWYMTREGCGCYAFRPDSGEDFFSSLLPERVTGEYFILYIHLLYQSYMLLLFAEQIEDTLPADAASYRIQEEETVRMLEEIRTRIDVFLVKGVHTSVSHLDQQNKFYDYGETRLTIREDIRSVTTGLESLESLQRQRLDQRQKEKEQKEREKEKAEKEANDRLNGALALIAILAIVSALADGLGFADAVCRWAGISPAQGVLRVLMIAATLVIAFFVLYIGVPVLRMIFGKKKD